MRKLTIKRAKRFVASLMKMKVYVEDAQSSELLINGVPCKKLGTLANGEEATFEIGNEAAKIYVIADRVSKNYCNEFYQLESGEEDILLTGKNCCNPLSGNPFRFDNNENPEVLELRKKTSKKAKKLFLICFVIGFIVGLVCGFAGIF